MTDEQNKEIEQIYFDYQNIVRPLIAVLEVDDKKYPVEILNEIRAVMNHLSKLALVRSEPDNSDKEAIISSNIHDAKSHLKRAILDCYKYSCISQDDSYTKFCAQMAHVDLSVIDNGVFHIELAKKYTSARNALKEAKKAEHENTSLSPDAVYDKFQSAFERYGELTGYIEASLENAEKAKHKQTFKQTVGYVIGVVGVLVGVVGYFL